MIEEFHKMSLQFIRLHTYYQSMTTTKKKAKKPVLKTFAVSEQIFLNWECKATSAKEAREMYEYYIADNMQLEELVKEALANKWDAGVNVEEVKE